jgi:hypothetical protein
LGLTLRQESSNGRRVVAERFARWARGTRWAGLSPRTLTAFLAERTSLACGADQTLWARRTISARGTSRSGLSEFSGGTCCAKIFSSFSHQINHSHLLDLSFPCLQMVPKIMGNMKFMVRFILFCELTDAPGGPCRPRRPRWPFAPLGPASPDSPLAPSAPGAPDLPRGPICPSTP